MVNDDSDESYEWCCFFLNVFVFVWEDLEGRSEHRNEVKHVYIVGAFAILRGKCGKLAGLS